MRKDKFRLFKALYGCENGDWELVPEKMNCQVSEEAFANMSDKAKELLLVRFFKLPSVPKKDQVITSADGYMSLPAKANEMRRKPGVGPRKRGYIRTKNFKRKREDKLTSNRLEAYEKDTKKAKLDESISDYQEDYCSDDEIPTTMDDVTMDDVPEHNDCQESAGNETISTQTKTPKQKFEAKWQELKSSASKIFHHDDSPKSPQEKVKSPILKLTSKDIRKRKPVNLKMTDLVESEEEFVANVEPSTTRTMPARNSKNRLVQKPAASDDQVYGEFDIPSPKTNLWEEASVKRGVTYSDRMETIRAKERKSGKS